MARSGCWSCSSSSRRRSLRWAVRRGDTWTPPDARAGGRRQLRAEVAPPAASRSPRSMSPRSMRLERTPPSHQQAGAASCGRRWRRRPPAARRARCAELNAASAPAGGRHRRRSRCTGPGCRRPPRQMVVASCERGGSRRPPAARRARPGCRRQHAESGRARRLPRSRRALLPICFACDASQAAISRRYRRGRRRDITARPWAGPWRGAASTLARQRMPRPRYRGDIAVSNGAISRRGLGLTHGAVRLLPWRGCGCPGRDIAAISPWATARYHDAALGWPVARCVFCLGAAADAQAAISRRYRREQRRDITARPWAGP